MRRKKLITRSLVNFSPWLFAAACAMLTFIIVVFAVNNYQREKRVMLDALLRQGQTILHFVKASTRGAMRGARANIRTNVWEWTDYVQKSIDGVIDQRDLLFIQLLDKEGKVLAANGKSTSFKSQKTISQDNLDFIKKLYGRDDETIAFRVLGAYRELHGVFQVAMLYHPFGEWGNPPRLMQQRGMMRGMPMPPPGAIEDTVFLSEAEKLALHEYQNIQSQEYILLAELDLSDFKSAMRRQLLQIVFLSLVLLLVGLGGWLSLLTLQGLRGSQSRLQSMQKFSDLLIASLPVGLLAFGNDGKINICNTSAETMIGIDSRNVLGLEPAQVLPPEIAMELSRQEKGIHQQQAQEISFIDKEGRTKALILLLLRMVDREREFAGNTLLIQDVSQIKELQKEVRRNERLAALGKMAAGVAHELRNPLSSIKGLALLLKSKVKRDSKGIETADILIKEVERLNRSIGELLEYSRPDKLQLEELQVEDVILQSLRLLDADLAAAEIQMSTEFQKSAPVLADRDKLQQVFLNIILNSIQALPVQGQIHISVREEQGYCICTVADNGCGIGEESVARVFDPYFTTKNEGTGLGLAMSAKIIEAHKGRIEFSSQKDKGTVVNIILQSAVWT